MDVRLFNSDAGLHVRKSASVVLSTECDDNIMFLVLWNMVHATHGRSMIIIHCKPLSIHLILLPPSVTLDNNNSTPSVPNYKSFQES